MKRYNLDENGMPFETDHGVFAEASVAQALYDALERLIPIAISDLQQWSSSDPEDADDIKFARKALSLADGEE